MLSLQFHEILELLERATPDQFGELIKEELCTFWLYLCFWRLYFCTWLFSNSLPERYCAMMSIQEGYFNVFRVQSGQCFVFMLFCAWHFIHWFICILELEWDMLANLRLVLGELVGDGLLLLFGLVSTQAWEVEATWLNLFFTDFLTLIFFLDLFQFQRWPCWRLKALLWLLSLDWLLFGLFNNLRLLKWLCCSLRLRYWVIALVLIQDGTCQS